MSNQPDAGEIRSDLTGYAALLGESFESRVDLLERIIQGAHYPSLGRYKERLLATLLREYLPRTVEVGSGFVMFPVEDRDPPGGADHHDPLNQSAFVISRQCDIIVYESHTVPPVFRDGDFVVVRPEAVRAVVEVKGSLSLDETSSIVEWALDFARKWATTQKFYRERHQGNCRPPALLALAWRFKKRGDGSDETSARRVRERIAQCYQKELPGGTAAEFPILEHLYIHRECQVSSVLNLDDDESRLGSMGWDSRDGRFIRFDKGGQPFRDGDRTIAALLAALHWCTAREGFNRFFSYPEETRHSDLVPFDGAGFSAWYEVEANADRL